MNDYALFLTGGTATACVAIGLFFLRFWRRTDDRFFLLFALAFWVFALNRVALAVIGDEDESARMVVYVVRLAAFLLILTAIVDKNRRPRRAR